MSPTNTLPALENLANELTARQLNLNINQLTALCSSYHVGGHLVIMTGNYLDMVLDGRKTVESRFSVNRIAPYKTVAVGDVLFFKRSGGAICALALVKAVSYYGPLKRGEAASIIHRTTGLMAESEFIREKENSTYCTLIKISNVKCTRPISINKADRRGWIAMTIGSKNDRTC